MTILHQVLLLVFCGITGGVEIDLASPAVFSPVFYLNNYPDIKATTEAEARHHWLNVGIESGLQGSGAFHTVQYIKRYPDLPLYNNYTNAIIDYIMFGRDKGRLGYMEFGYEGRYTISNRMGVFASGSRRMGLAVESIVWNDYEFINAWDHGRELQMTMTSPPYGECFKPTEAGGRDDRRTNSTATQIYAVSALDNELYSVVYPAFWLRPGDNETRPTHNSKCTKGSPAVNKDKYYKYSLSKTITIGCYMEMNSDICLTFFSQLTIGGTWPKYDYLQFELPTAYLSVNFTVINSIDVMNKRLVSFNSSLPVIMSTPDQKYAMGAYAPPKQNIDYPITYGTKNFPSSNIAAATNKWNVVFKKNATPSTKPLVLNYQVIMCVGNLKMATNCIIKAAEAQTTTG